MDPHVGAALKDSRQSSITHPILRDPRQISSWVCINMGEIGCPQSTRRHSELPTVSSRTPTRLSPCSSRSISYPRVARASSGNAHVVRALHGSDDGVHHDPANVEHGRQIKTSPPAPGSTRASTIERMWCGKSTSNMEAEAAMAPGGRTTGCGEPTLRQTLRSEDASAAGDAHQLVRDFHGFRGAHPVK